MSEDIAAPNWLRELEEKREQKLKARLGHEAGAGSPCNECKEKCPGLDLHFWRKICKICKCGKENHGVFDDDATGWVQFNLLGSKPKSNNKIRLPGSNEIELDWTPKGSKEVIERYFRDLPPDQLPIKGSSAAKERKQLLQKQIPLHDVDPSMCHALSEEETKRMNDYINHLKDASVGVGEIRNFQTPVQANLVTSRVQLGKHDYENIDAFGNHKLAASLEEIKLQQQRMENGESISDQGNFARAQYALLLNANSSPLKDSFGKPITANLDLFGNPILDSSLMEKVGPLAKIEYALLLDKHGAPILTQDGNPIKKPIENISRHKTPYILNKFGNEVKPYLGLLLDKNKLPVCDKYGSPIKLKMDVYGQPILEKSLSEIINGPQEPKYITYLDKNGASILGPNGLPIMKPILGPEQNSKFSIFLDKDKKVLKNMSGEPITVYLDHFKAPIINESTLEELDTRIPSYCVLLDDKGETMEVQTFNAYKDPVLDKFDNNVRPQYGLLLDEHECPMKDALGSPIKVPLDPFLRPKYELQTLEKLQSRCPEYVMFLDRNGAPILDKYGSPIKNITYSNRENIMPRYALLLDKNEKTLKDANGMPVRALVDILGRPLDKNLQKEAKYSMDVDNTSILQPIMYLQVPTVASSNNLPKPQWSSLVSRNHKLEELNGAKLISASGVPILDLNGDVIDIKLDMDGYPIINPTNSDIQGAHFLGKNGIIVGDNGKPLSMKVDRNGASINGTPVFIQKPLDFPPVIDKHGNVIDPRTGRPMQLGGGMQTPVEYQQEPTRVNIGIVKDINTTPKYNNVDRTLNNMMEDLDTTLGGESFDIPQCHRCKQVIENNALVIQIDRSNALWHTGCFKCAGCNQNIVDLFYCYHKESDDIYCGRDYAKIRGIPRCNACDELIFVKEYCMTEDMTYHVKHFCCFECDTPLAGKDYLMEQNQPVCIPCYEQVKADKCLACDNIIRPHEQGANLNGDHFHATDECFSCKQCRKPLLGAKFLYRGKKLFCSSICFNSSQN